MKAVKSRSVVPQSFDRNPYVSLTDGRKIAYYTHTKNLLNDEEERGKDASVNKFIAIKNGLIRDHELAAPAALSSSSSSAYKPITHSHMETTHRPVHMFNNTMWPNHSRHAPSSNSITTSTPPSSLLTHNSNANSSSSGGSSFQGTYASCQSCKARFVMCFCPSCARQFCFKCAFRYSSPSTPLIYPFTP